jgi:hypothetical protein
VRRSGGVEAKEVDALGRDYMSLLSLDCLFLLSFFFFFCIIYYGQTAYCPLCR